MPQVVHALMRASRFASTDGIGDCSTFLPSLRFSVSVCAAQLTSLDSHNIYKWQADKRRQAARARSASFAGSTRSTDPAFQHIHEPGGFRRNYLIMRRGDDGPSELPHHVPRNFIEFLYLFGHFVSAVLLDVLPEVYADVWQAGEDLEEVEEEEDDPWGDLEAQTDRPSQGTDHAGEAPLSLGLPPETSNDLHKASERSPLLPRSRSRRARSHSVSSHGDATVTQAVLMVSPH